jgi:hypothetical protein
MQETNDNHNLIFEGSTWYSVAELSSDEAGCNDEQAAVLMDRSLFQTMQRLGLPPEYIKRMEATLSEAARGAGNPSNPCLQDVPVRIRLLCSKRTFDRLNQSDDQLKGGWSYYVIEKSRDLPNDYYQDPCRMVEIYLYKEGE